MIANPVQRSWDARWLIVAAVALMLAVPLPADGGEPAAVVRSVKSGLWSAESTWDAGHLPAADDRVLVRSGHEVVYDVENDQKIRVLKVAGALRFAHDKNTRLVVGLLRVEDGDEVSDEGFDCAAHGEASTAGAPRPTLEVGTPERPIDAEHRAVIQLAYCEGMDKQSCPALVCCGGRMDLHGAAMNRTWVKLGAPLDRGATEITLAEPVEGWRIGDRVLIPSTDTPSLFERGDNRRPVVSTVRENSHSEERTIVALADKTITLDVPLKFRHRAEGNFRGEVANLSRNVIVESADPGGERGHTMYHAGSAGSISYAEFRHLGKRGVLGRYGLHFHECRDTMRGSSVIGASIHDSDNRWLTIHGTDYLVVRDCVGYNSVGHGFFLEDGTEVFNVLDRNLAVQARHGTPLPKQMLPYDENEGAGFWWANSLNTFTRNVAAECDQYGYRFEATKTPEFDPVLQVPRPDGSRQSVDIRTLPFVRFADNEAHSHRRFAMNLGGIRHVSDEVDHQAVRTPGADLSRIQGGHVQGVGPDTQHPYVIRNLRVWSSQWVFHGGSPCVLIDGLEAIDCAYGIFKTRMDAHEYKNLNLKRIDTAEIFEPWGNSNVEENYFRYLDPTDDLPPTTVITQARLLEPGKLLVRGTTADDGRIKEVLVNGRPAKSLRDGLAEWQLTLDCATDTATCEVTAQAKDAAGNLEPRPHRIVVPTSSTK